MSLLNAYFDAFINNIVNLIDKLPPMSDRMYDFKRKIKFAKGIGLTLSSIGAVGLIVSSFEKYSLFLLIGTLLTSLVFIIEKDATKRSLNIRFNIFFEQITQLIEKFRILRNEMEKFHSKCNFARGVGSIFSFVGIAGLAAATSGASVGFGRYTASLIGGIVTSVLVRAVDKEATQKCLADVKKLLNDFAIEMVSMEPLINYITRVLTGNDEEIAVLHGAKVRISKTFQNVQKLASEEKTVVNNGELEKLVKLLKGRNIPKLMAVLKSEGGAFAAVIEKILKMLPFLEGLLEKASVENAELLSDIAVCLQGLVQLVEIIVDVRTCLREHPTVEMIDIIVPKLESIKVDYQCILDQLSNVNNTGGLVARIGFKKL